MNKSKPVAIVTGSSRGVGAATVKLLAKNGYNVVVNYSKSEKEAREVQAACESLGAETLLCRADVAEDNDCRRMACEAMDKWGRIDVLVNKIQCPRQSRRAIQRRLPAHIQHQSSRPLPDDQGSDTAYEDCG